MNLIEIFSILLIHWIADFVAQTDSQAKNKSKNNLFLVAHTLNYSMIFFMGIAILYASIYGSGEKVFWFSLWFTIITFICHTITDYFTSRLNSKLWEQGKVHNFFVSIGFDQVLHYVQLFTTYWLLTK
jgi:hypothetical protein